MLLLTCSPGQLHASDLPMTLLAFSRQTALGMVYLSGKGFVHRDIAARNILLSHNNICKVQHCMSIRVTPFAVASSPCLCTYSCIRFVTLGCHVILRRITTTFLVEEKCRSNGQHQKLLLTRSTRQPVMCGAMAVFSTRCGALDINPLKKTPTRR